MPLPVMDDAAIRAAIGELKDDLAHLFAQKEVPRLVQAAISRLRVRSIRIFARIESTEADVRRWLASDVGLSATDGAAAKVDICLVLDAWDAARKRVTKADELEAESHAMGRTPQISSGDHLVLQRAFETAYGETPERDMADVVSDDKDVGLVMTTDPS